MEGVEGGSELLLGASVGESEEPEEKGGGFPHSPVRNCEILNPGRKGVGGAQQWE